MYITEKSKIISWNPNKTKHIGVVYRTLPNFTGNEAPHVLMKEETPKNGMLPTDGPGLDLFKEMVDVIKSSDGDILQTWSCSTPAELANDPVCLIH